MSILASDLTADLDNLKKPVQIGAWNLRNKIIMSSLTRSRSVPVDVPNEFNVEYYRQRAGAGLILSEGTIVSPQGVEWAHVPGIYSSAHAVAWKKVTDAVHAEGGLIVAQLWHVGRVAHPDMPEHKLFGKPVSAPSPIKAAGGKFRELGNAPHVAPTQEHPNPWELVEEFRQGAIYAKEAGFDGVELHGANGYLPVQFLDKNSNHRTDEWGGSLENRARFMIEALKALVEVWGPDRVGIKLTPEGGYNDVGMSAEDTIESYSYIINHAVDTGIAYIQLVRYLEFMDFMIDGKWRAQCNLDHLSVFAPLIKTPTSKTALIYNGNLSASESESLVEQKKIDAPVIGRSFINNPDLVRRLFEQLPLNESLGHPAVPKTFYAFKTGPAEGYTDYPTYEEVQKAKTA